jgi:membrane-associated phospholipid phosphatase
MKLTFSTKVAYLLLAFALFMTACQKDDETQEPNDIILNPASDYDNTVVRSWLQTYMDVEKDMAGFRPAATSRALGYIWMTAYETALPGMPDFISNETKLSGLDVPNLPLPSENYDWNIAINTAIAKSMRHLMPGADDTQLYLISNMEATVNSQLASGLSAEVVSNSKAWGAQVADAVMAYADTDAEAVNQALDPFPDSYVPPVGDGLWVHPSAGKALFPYWGTTRTFANFGDDLIALPPPPFSTDPSSLYYRDFKEVNDIATNLTNEQRWIAEFWSDDIVGLTFSPPARIFQIANQLIEIEGFDLETSLHLLVKLGIACNDAAVAAWNSKYIYNVERPINFIPAYINPEFKTILGNAIGTENITPPFPGYPSGHSTFGGLCNSVLSSFFGEEYLFTDRCHEGRTEFIGAPRTYTTMTELAEENAYSRIPLGVHPRFDCVEGLRLGKLIGNNAINYNLKK